MPNRPTSAVDRDRVEIHAIRVIVEEILRHNLDLIPQLRITLTHRVDLRPAGDSLPAMMPADPYVRDRAMAILDHAEKKG
jgi:hypothetical protein